MVRLSILAGLIVLFTVFGLLPSHLNPLISEAQAQYVPPPPPPSPPPPPPPPGQPPGPFGHVNYVASCPIPYQPKITISWTAAQYATAYRIYWLDQSVGSQQPPGGIPIGNVTSYTLNTSNGLTPGHYYGFVLAAENPYGASVTNQPPYSPVASGGWSHYIYGWALFPECSPPGPFNFSVAPTPVCPGVATSAIDMQWTSSAGASYYQIYPQSTIRGWSSGFPPTSPNYFRHIIPTPIPANEGWEYTIWAVNAYGQTAANNSSSYYIFGGWTWAYNCDNPVVDLKIDGTDVIKTINNGSSVQLTYRLTGSYSAATYATPSVNGVTTPWTSIYPPNTTVSNPWLTTGSSIVTLFNNATYPNASYQFTIQAGNQFLPLSANNPVSKTVTVNVLPAKAPFIQTTQGDVHSNSNINVPQ